MMKNIRIITLSLLIPICGQAQVSWTAASAPVQSTISGGPWTLSQGGPVTPITPTDYCVNGTPLINPATTVSIMQPYYFPFVIGRGSNLKGYFDYRPRNINEATVAANSTDGGLTWHFQQMVEQLTAGCPSDNVNSSGNDAGQGHPTIISFGGATWLYLLDRRSGHVDSDGLLVHRLTPAAASPLNPLPLNAYQVPPAANTIARWDFSNYTPTSPITVVNSPVTVIGTGVSKVLGMTNSYSYVSPKLNNSVAGADIINTGGSSNAASPNAWRIRGYAPGSGNGTGNGWNTAAPQYTQGAEFDASTSGKSNIVFEYDWYSTNQGVRDLQAQYTIDGVNWTNVGPLQIATPSAFNNQIRIDFGALGITAVNNNPSFGVRLVSAYDPTYTGPGAPTYTSATVDPTSGLPVVYNNSSGNWRFAEVNILSSATPLIGPDVPVNTTGLINPDGIIATVPGTYPIKVIYVSKTLSGDQGTSPYFSTFTSAQQCGLTPSGKAANHDVDQIRIASTPDGIYFTDGGVLNGLNDIHSTSYSAIRYVAPNGSLVKLPNGKWGLFYGGGNCLDGDSDGFHVIAYAESSDLINWTIVNGINNPIASVSTVTAIDPISTQSVTIPANAPVIGATQPWFAGRVYNPNAMVSTTNTINLIFAGYNAGYSADLSSYRTIGQVVLSPGAVTLP